MSGNSPEQQRQDAHGPDGARTDGGAGGDDQSRPPQSQPQQTPKAPKPVIVSSASAAGRSGDDSQSGSVTSSPPTASNDSTASSYGHGDDIYGVVTVSPVSIEGGVSENNNGFFVLVEYRLLNTNNSCRLIWDGNTCVIMSSAQ